MKLSLFKQTATKGRAAESLACQYLRQQGLDLIEQNFHSRHGEVDLIMQHHDSLVFVEVRYRKNHDFGGALASITPQKQQKIRKTALSYMQSRGREFIARFDVVALHGPDDNLQIEWIQNAF